MVQRLSMSSKSSTEEAHKEVSHDEATLGIEQPSALQMDRVYRKLDARIIPALWCLYFLTSFGSSAYGLTLTMNKESGHLLGQQLKLTSHDTATASALYYVGYIIFDLPMNLAMTKLAPQAWLSRIVITVGLVYACYAALHNSLGLIGIRFVSGMVGAGTWPGMTYYISLWYPNERSTRRIGYYFTAAQISAAVAGLVSAGFQKIDMNRGYTGWQWMYLTYGSITIFVGILLIWWLPDRPFKETQVTSTNKVWRKIQQLTTSPKPLNAADTELHRRDFEHRYQLVKWGWKDVVHIVCDFRIWPLIIMYFGVVGVGFGLAVFGSTIISALNPNLSGINVSLLYAPIWLFDLSGILLITPLADKFKKFRPLFFCCACLVIMCGLFVTTYAHGFWNRWAGLLICGFGLGPTVPITMAWGYEIFQLDYGDVGTAVAAAVISGLGNLGSVTSTYALYSGWPEDKARLFQYSNMMLVVMLGGSMIACAVGYVMKDRVKPKRFLN